MGANLVPTSVSVASAAMSQLQQSFRQESCQEVFIGQSPCPKEASVQVYAVSQMAYVVSDVHSLAYIADRAIALQNIPPTIAISNMFSTAIGGMTGICNVTIAQQRLQTAITAKDGTTARLQRLAILRGATEASAGIAGTSAVLLQNSGRFLRKYQIVLNRIAKNLGRISSGCSFACYGIMTLLYSLKCIRSIYTWNTLTAANPQEHMAALRRQALELTAEEVQVLSQSLPHNPLELIGRSIELQSVEFQRITPFLVSLLQHVSTYLEATTSDMDVLARQQIALQATLHMAKQGAFLLAYKEERFAGLFGEDALLTLQQPQMSAKAQLESIRFSAMKTLALNGATAAIGAALLAATLLMVFSPATAVTLSLTIYLISCCLALIVDSYYLCDALRSEPELTPKTQNMLLLGIVATTLAMVLGIVYATSPLLLGVAIAIGTSTLLVQGGSLVWAHTRAKKASLDGAELSLRPLSLTL